MVVARNCANLITSIPTLRISQDGCVRVQPRLMRLRAARAAASACSQGWCVCARSLFESIIETSELGTESLVIS